MDWASLYPAHAIRRATEEENVVPVDESRAENEEAQSERTRAIAKDVEIADIGCGFGGLLFALATKFPDTLSIGTSSPSARPSFPSKSY